MTAAEQQSLQHRAGQVLDYARMLIERGWTQWSSARRADGTHCEAAAPDAACWCANGAIMRAGHDLMIERNSIMDEARAALTWIIQARYDQPNYNNMDLVVISTFNDEKHRSRAAVVDCFERATQRLWGGRAA